MNRVAQYAGAGTAFDWQEAVGFGRQPFASLSCGPCSPVAGPNGLAIGAFCWLDTDTGQASNSFVPGALMGFVLPLANPYNLWQRAFVRQSFPFPQMVIRPGVSCVIAASGCFNVKFPDGGQAGSRVYADPQTGLPYVVAGGELMPVSFDESSITMDDTNVTMDQQNLIPTKWTLLQSGRPGSRLFMSTFVQPFNS
jgi:hypothetical protein